MYPGKSSQAQIQEGIVKIREVAANNAAKENPIGNSYLGSYSSRSQDIRLNQAGDQAVHVGYNMNGYINYMNRLNGSDYGERPTYVAHEFGHTLGLDDEFDRNGVPGTYFSPDGIMKYSNKNYLQNPSDADVKNILKVASERLQNGNVSGEAKVELLEERLAPLKIHQ